jgi:phage-related protein
MISDLDEYKTKGIVKVAIRNKDGSLREPFVDEFRDAVRVERPFSKKLKKIISRQKRDAKARGEEWKPHPSLLISD